MAVLSDGGDSWQTEFFCAAVLLILWQAWRGWRIGLVRQIVSIVALAAAYVVGYIGGGPLGAVLHTFVDLPEHALAVFGAAALGLVVYGSIILIGRIVFKKTAQQSVTIVRLGYGATGAVFGALYGLFLVWIAVLAVRLLGSVAEAQIDVAKNARLSLGKPTPTPVPVPPSAVARGLAHMKKSLEQGAAGAVVEQVDPIPGTLYATLHKLGVMASDERNIERFLKFPGVQPLLAHPKIAALQSDPQITRDIVQRDYFALIRNPRIIDVANDAEIGELMRKFEFEKALDYAIRSPEQNAKR